MDAIKYESIQETLEVRLLQFQIGVVDAGVETQFKAVEQGRRTAVITIATTLTDADEYSKEDIARLSGFGWNIDKSVS